MQSKKFSVDVDYYDAAHKNALMSICGIQPDLAQVAGRTIEIPEGEFLTYSLFTKLGTGPDHFMTLSSIQRIARQYARPLHDYFSFSRSLRLKKTGFDPENGLRERVGVALGLSTISRIHGMTLADWVRIPVMRTKHLDFQLASNGQRKVQVETKGSVVTDNTKKTEVSHHARSIALKKKYLATLPKEAAKWKASVRYGTIAAIDNLHQAKVWLLDPEPESVGWDPKQLRLLARFGFLAAWLSMISPYSEISWALRRRYGELVKSNQPFDFNRRPLIGRDKKTIYADADGRVDTPGNFFYGKFDFDGKIVVRSIHLRRGQRLLLGVRRELFDLAVSQDFSAISNYQTENARLEGELKKGKKLRSVDRKNQTVTLHQTSFGTAISVLCI